MIKNTCRIKYKYCYCFPEYTNFTDDLTEYKWFAIRIVKESLMKS